MHFLMHSTAGRRLALVIATASLLALPGAGCGGDDECGDLSNVTYRSHAQFVVSRHCVSCHDAALDTLPERSQAPQTHNYNTFTEVAKWADRMAERLIIDNDMPPGGGVPSCDKQIFQAWINAGKPER